MSLSAYCSLIGEKGGCLITPSIRTVGRRYEQPYTILFDGCFLEKNKVFL
jgi:hypothetical protein